MIPQAAEQEREADHAVQYDHDHRKHGVTRQRRITVARIHKGGDHHHFDPGDRQGQNHGSHRFAEPLCKVFRMTKDGKGGENNHEQEPAEDGTQSNGIREIAQPLMVIVKEQGGSSDRQEQGPFSKRPAGRRRGVAIREVES